MKNIKNTLAATVLAAVMGFSTVSAHAGLLISDRSVANDKANCTATDGGILSSLAGILIVGATSSATGILIVGRSGLLISDRSAQCVENQKEGILIVG